MKLIPKNPPTGGPRTSATWQILFSAALVAACATFSTASGQILAWDFTGENTVASSVAEVKDTNLVGPTAGTLTRGAGAAASIGGNSFRTVGFQNNGISTGNTDYFETSFAANTGYTLSLSTIDARMAGTAGFAVSPGVSSQFAYSLDGTNFTLIGSPSLTVGTPANISVPVSTITALQNVPSTTTVTIRYYASGQTTTGGWGFISSASGVNGLAFAGSVSAVGSLPLTLNIAPATFSESASNPAATGTVSIPAALGSDLVVTLASSDTTEATVPATVTILAGATSATFNVTAVDDLLADGSQPVNISASATGYSNAGFSLSVTNDTDAPLAISFSQDPIVENAGPNASIGTVTLAAPTVSDLTVNLTSSDTTEATVPASIVIPAGQPSGTFQIDAVNDTEVDGTKTSLITASAAGYTTGTKVLTINDDGDTVPPPTIPVNGIAFTGYSAEGDDELAFVALAPIAGGDTILFTDNEWDGGTVGAGGAFNTGEGILTWTAPVGGITAGTVVQLHTPGAAGRTASLGTITSTVSNFALAVTGDTVYAFQGAPTTVTRVLAVISTLSADSIIGTGLTDYVLLADGTDIGAYNGSRTSETTYDPGYLALINAEANWVTQDTGANDATDTVAPDVPFSSTAFTLASAGNTFASWVAANVTPPQPAGFTADHDSDGVRNGVEYFMGATGSTFTAMPAPVTVGGISSVSYPRDATATGVTYKVQTSPDLVTWTDIAPGDPNLDTSNPAIVKYTLPTGSGKLFTRLDVITTTP